MSTRVTDNYYYYYYIRSDNLCLNREKNRLWMLSMNRRKKTNGNRCLKIFV